MGNCGVELAQYRLGVDIGGTFTDIVSLGPEGQALAMKVPSTPRDYGIAIVEGITRLLTTAGICRDRLTEIVHATTVVTNTVLEGKGARTAFVATRGFRDLLGMRRLRIPVMYDLRYCKPPPLVPRALCFEAPGRLGPDGTEWEPLDSAALARLAEEVAACNPQSVAICLMHAYANDRHERAVEAVLRGRLGAEVTILRSSAVLPEIREYERASTTVVSAYVAPAVRNYLAGLGNRLAAAGLDAPLTLVQSNGGAMSVSTALARPALLLESGPAAGVIACARAAALAGIRDVVSFDMGGTTAKAALIENARPARSSEYEVGGGINLSSALVRGGGYVVRLPIVDISEIGAGGGSLVTLGPAGTLKVGPESAGADPGPACYGRGGEAPTFTDAMVVLGYINPDFIAGGEVAVHRHLAERALTERIARPLGKPLVEVAHGILAVAAATMTRAVKAVTTYRGRDPRDFALFAFGGNGPLAAAAIAEELGIQRIVVPPGPGVFSAFGLPLSDLEHEVARSVMLPCVPASEPELGSVLSSLQEQVLEGMAADGADPASAQIERIAELRFVGQAFELAVPLAQDSADAAALARDFLAEHRQTYGHGSETDPVQVVALRLRARVSRGHPGRIRWAAARAPTGQYRQVYFGPRHADCPTPVIGRADLDHDWRPGPLIVEEDDATTVVPPGWRARRDLHDNIELRRDTGHDR
jgi:N-methylhydantoinase A